MELNKIKPFYQIKEVFNREMNRKANYEIKHIQFKLLEIEIEFLKELMDYESLTYKESYHHHNKKYKALADRLTAKIRPIYWRIYPDYFEKLYKPIEGN